MKMITKDDRIAEAKEHYKARRDNRPKQVWDKDRRVWVKIPKEEQE